MKKLCAVDLFCGIGGMTYGLTKGGVPVVAGIDVDKSCEYAFVTNNRAKFIHADISKVKGKDLVALYPSNAIRVLVGCAPCQPFSKFSTKNRNRLRGGKWKLLEEFSRLIKEVDPDIVSMENVPQLVRYGIYDDFLDDLLSQGYCVSQKIVSCTKYGVPQARQRLVVLASRFGAIELLPETHTEEDFKSVIQTIGQLEKLTAGSTSAKDPMHRAPALSPLNIRRIQASIPGGTWRDWKVSLRTNCHRKDSGASFRTVYGRMKWDKPGPTITTQFYSFGTGRFGHPEQDRALSIREGAMLQTFPKGYKLLEPTATFSFKRLGTHIGNAVPVKLATVIAKSITQHVENLTSNH